jgi:hypothetical protein
MRPRRAYRDVSRRIRRVVPRLWCWARHRYYWKVIKLETSRVGTTYRCRVCGRVYTARRRG